MCGIGGILRVTPPGQVHEPIPEEWLDAIDREIAWRGRDGAGRFRDRVVRADGTTVEVALVHRRLAIIDIEGGHQPMVVEGCPACEKKASGHQGTEASSGSREPGSGRIAVVFNGCIYNHRELRAELEAEGHVFATNHSDTEVIAHVVGGDFELLYEEMEGYASQTDRVEGMRAAATWLGAEGQLVLQRDRFGEKPLYTLDTEGGITLFASAPMAIDAAISLAAPKRRAASGQATRPDRSVEQGLRAWLADGWSHNPPLSRLKSAPRYAPCILPGQPFPVGVPSRGPLAAIGIALLVIAVLAVLGTIIVFGVIAAVIAVAIGAVALGAFVVAILVLPIPPQLALRAVGWTPSRAKLSKTVDRFESLLSDAIAERLEADVPLGCFLSGGIDSSLIAYFAMCHLGHLTSVTVRMPDDRYDESRGAARVARTIGSDHHVIDVAPDPGTDLVLLIEAMGLPFGDASILPTYWACRAAREAGLKVVLSGDGGDEMFCGYERYSAANLLPWLRAIAWAIPTRRFDRRDPTSRSDKLARLILAARGGGYRDLVANFPSQDARELLGPKRRAAMPDGWCFSAGAARRWDIDTYLPSDLLRKVDTASMLAQVEVRCPFLDPQLAEAALKMPIRVLMPRGRPKGLLRMLAARYFPPEITERPKQGFAIPIGDWFRTDFGGMRTLLLDHLSKDQPFGVVHETLDINMAYVRRIVDEHMAAGGARQVFSSVPARPRDHSRRLFGLLSLAIWAGTLE